MAFLAGPFDEAQVGVETVRINVGTRVGTQVVAAYYQVGREVTFGGGIAVPDSECAVVGGSSGKVTAGINEVHCCGPVFGKELRVRVQGRLCAFADADDHGVIVLLPNGNLTLQEGRISEDVFAVQHGVRGACILQSMGA